MDRADVTYPLDDKVTIAEVERPLSLWERVSRNTAVRRVVIIALFALAWELSARYTDNDLMFPTLSEAFTSLVRGVASGALILRALTTLETLIVGYFIALALAMLLAMFAMSSSFGADVLTTFASMFNPLPALAILPVVLLWLGISTTGLIVVMVQSVVWTIALNTYTGFQGVPPTLRMAGKNFGLSGAPYFFRILIPAAFPSILAGMKIGWAHAWRTLIGAELVFGVASRSGGIGWYIYENKAQFETANVFAGLLTVIVIGFAVENLLFRTVEARTIRRWGMVS